MARDQSEFWMTTGLYPQEITIDLGSNENMNNLSITTTGAKQIQVLGTDSVNSSEYKVLGEIEQPDNGGSTSTGRVSLVGGQDV